MATRKPAPRENRSAPDEDAMARERLIDLQEKKLAYLEGRLARYEPSVLQTAWNWTGGPAVEAFNPLSITRKVAYLAVPAIAAATLLKAAEHFFPGFGIERLAGKGMQWVQGMAERGVGNAAGSLYELAAKYLFPQKKAL